MRNRTMSPGELQKHILKTYVSLRIGIAALGIAFPFVLAIGGYFYAHLCLQNSMSAYYHASVVDERSMRNWFVGILFVVAFFLYLYKGFSPAEDYALNVAGILAIGVAVFPMAWSDSSLIVCSSDVASTLRHVAAYSPKLSLHGTCAVGFFLCIAFVCLFCAGDTLSLVKEESLRKKLAVAYRSIGIAMIAAMAAAYILSSWMKNPSRSFYVEAAGILAFGAYWWLKSWELGKTAADAKAIRGHLMKADGKLKELQ